MCSVCVVQMKLVFSGEGPGKTAGVLESSLESEPEKEGRLEGSLRPVFEKEVPKVKRWEKGHEQAQAWQSDVTTSLRASRALTPGCRLTSAPQGWPALLHVLGGNSNLRSSVDPVRSSQKLELLIFANNIQLTRSSSATAARRDPSAR